MDLAQQLQQLYSQFGDTPGITIELHKELVAINVKTNKATATVFLQGAQVSHYQRHHEQPILWLSPTEAYRQGQALRGGIPICFPWFGDLAKNPSPLLKQTTDTGGFPAHGFVRNQDWQLKAITLIDEATTQLQLEKNITADESAAWPFNCILTATINIGCDLHIDFQVLNTDQQAFYYTSALHSYFAVNAISTIDIEGLDGCHYIDCLDQWQNKQQQQSLRIDQEVDRIYKNNGQRLSIIDRQLNRKLHIDSQGSNSVVIWNPWIEKSKTLSSFEPDMYQKMLCIETANADHNLIHLQPQQQHNLHLHISSEKI